MTNRAVIYVRTSSEHQGEKSSPAEQEADCRKLAAENGLIVVGVYRDTERYRAKNKLVEPSGTRSDRPRLVSMLRDAQQGHFEVILAWREDRLYRGMRAMLTVLETIQECRITIMLARETFDPKIAPLKAWLAGMELDGMKERMTMGVKARLRAGKALNGWDRYGYERQGEVIVAVPEEAKWVRQILAWYVGGMRLQDIRRRLIEAGAPQKRNSKPRRIQWSKSSIEAILKAAKVYYTGVKEHTRMGEIFQISVPRLIDAATYKRYLKVRESNKTHPARNLKRDYLIGGLIYCSCNRKWGARSNPQRYRNRRGELVEYNHRTGVYYCPQIHKDHVSPDCPHSIGSKRADNEVWEKVCRAIYEPEILIAEAQRTVDELQANSDSLEAERDRLLNELDSIAMERQWVITQARKGMISEKDMELQLGSLDIQETGLRHDVVNAEQSLNIDSLGNWEIAVREYLADLQVGLESLNAEPQSEADRQEIFELKRQAVTTLVRRVTIDRNRELHVDISLDLLAIIKNRADNSCHQINNTASYCGGP